MVRQLTQFRRPDGTLSDHAADAIVIQPEQVIEFVTPLYKTVPPGFFLGVALRECSHDGKMCANMVCTDFDEHGRPRPLLTYGILQINTDELKEAIALGNTNSPDANLCDEMVNLAVGVTLFEKKASEIASAGKICGITLDVLRYTAWGWNAGMSEPLKSISRFGLDWDALCNRDENKKSPYMSQRMIPYANEVAEMSLKYPLTPST